MAISPSILLVEDDEDDYVLAREKLQLSFGADVRLDWVSSWDEGLAAIGDASHDIYLVDFRLGARTGLELVRAASERGCSKPIILLTGEDNPDIDREAMEAGAADYLVKGQITADQLSRVPAAEEDILRTYDLGASSFITKPISFDDLVKTLRTMTDYWFQIVSLPQH